MPSPHPLRELIARCDGDDPDAWDELWRDLESVVAGALASFARERGIALDLAEDIHQDYFLFLREDPASHLGAFRGGTWEEFHAFIRVGVRRFAQNSVRPGAARRLSCAAPFDEAISRRVDESGPGEFEIRVFVVEVVSIMTPRHRATMGRAIREAASTAGVGEARPAGDPKPLGRREKRLVEGLIRLYVPRVL